MSSSVNLEVLVAGARNGDRASLERLVGVCQPRLLRVASRSCPRADAEDAVQEVLWYAARRIATLRASAAFLGWTVVMLVRRCVQLARAAARLAPASEVPSTMTDEHVRLDLMRALQQLDPRSREVLLQRDLLHRTAKEVALLLNVSEDCVKSRHRRARQSLRAALDA